jgi:hypothetical protein
MVVASIPFSPPSGQERALYGGQPVGNLTSDYIHVNDLSLKNACCPVQMSPCRDRGRDSEAEIVR